MNSTLLIALAVEGSILVGILVGKIVCHAIGI
jgi:hypothetical protein